MGSYQNNYVICEFLEGGMANEYGNSLAYENYKLYSYNKCIAVRHHDLDTGKIRFVLTNHTKSLGGSVYTTITSNHIRQVYSKLSDEEYNYDFIVVKGWADESSTEVSKNDIQRGSHRTVWGVVKAFGRYYNSRLIDGDGVTVIEGISVPKDPLCRLYHFDEMIAVCDRMYSNCVDKYPELPKYTEYINKHGRPRYGSRPDEFVRLEQENIVHKKTCRDGLPCEDCPAKFQCMTSNEKYTDRVFWIDEKAIDKDIHKDVITLIMRHCSPVGVKVI